MNIAERNWLDAICRLGCCVCLREGRGATPGEPHHLLIGSRRIGDLNTIPLCQTHHRSGLKTQDFVSRHPWRTEFERRYGTERELLDWTRARLAQRIAA